MTYYVGTAPVTPYLEHFGILGMKWGVRKYQNPDGTLTSQGKVRYGVRTAAEKAKERNVVRREGQRELHEQRRQKVMKKMKPILAIGAGVAIAGVGAYLATHRSSTLSNSNIVDFDKYTRDLLKKNGSKFKYYDDWDLYSKYN